MNLLHILVLYLFKIYFNIIKDIHSCPFLYMHCCFACLISCSSHRLWT